MTPSLGTTAEPPGRSARYLFAGDTVLARAEVGDADRRRQRRRRRGAGRASTVRRGCCRPQRERVFHLPDPVPEVRKRPMPWVMVFAPMLLAVPMALFFGPRYLLFALFSPLMAIANFVSDRRAGRKDLLARQKEHDEELASVTERDGPRPGGRAVRAPAMTAPRPGDPADGQAIGPGPRLWERRATDPDYLRVRVGLADLPATVTRGGAPRQDRRRPRRRAASTACRPGWTSPGSAWSVVAGDEDTARAARPLAGGAGRAAAQPA